MSEHRTRRASLGVLVVLFASLAGCATTVVLVTFRTTRYVYRGTIQQLERDARPVFEPLNADVLPISPHEIAVRPRDIENAELRLRTDEGILVARARVPDSIPPDAVGRMRELQGKVRDLPMVGAAVHPSDGERAARVGTSASAPPVVSQSTPMPLSPPRPQPPSERRRRPR